MKYSSSVFMWESEPNPASMSRMWVGLEVGPNCFESTELHWAPAC